MKDQGFANPQEKVTIYSLPAECDVLVKGLAWEGCELVFIPCPVGVVAVQETRLLERDLMVGLGKHLPART